MWSSLATMIAIGIASNLDNAGVGIAYGVRRIRFSTLANSLIAVISGVATWVAGVLGRFVTHYTNPSVATWIGAFVIIAVGIWVMTEPWRSRRKTTESQSGNMMTRILRDPVEADFDKSQSISIPEALVLGVALALNALAGGFDAGVIKIEIIYTAISVALFSFILLGASGYIGRRYAAKALGNKATYIAGLLLIAVGIHQIW